MNIAYSRKTKFLEVQGSPCNTNAKMKFFQFSKNLIIFPHRIFFTSLMKKKLIEVQWVPIDTKWRKMALPYF